MRGWYIRDRENEKTYICKACGRSHDVPYDTCPDCGNRSKPEEKPE